MNAEPIILVRIYLVVFFSLIALTITTTAVAFIDLGAEWNSAVAVAIAVAKALLVILFFMHVRYSRWLMWVFVGVGFFWLAILFTLTLADYATRNIGTAPPTSAAPSAQSALQRATESPPSVPK